MKTVVPPVPFLLQFQAPSSDSHEAATVTRVLAVADLGAAGPDSALCPSWPLPGALRAAGSPPAQHLISQPCSESGAPGSSVPKGVVPTWVVCRMMKLCYSNENCALM